MKGSTKKAKARAAAVKNEGLAASLDERLADIDAVLTTERRELARLCFLLCVSFILLRHD